MSAESARSMNSAKDQYVVQDDSRQDQTLVLHVLKVATKRLEWTNDALAAHLNTALGRSMDTFYVAKMLDGTKPITLDVLHAFPLDVRVCFARLYAEALGHVVVTPLRGEEAAVAFAAGLLGLFAAQLPAKAGGQLKAELPATARREKVG